MRVGRNFCIWPRRRGGRQKAKKSRADSNDSEQIDRLRAAKLLAVVIESLLGIGASAREYFEEGWKMTAAKGASSLFAFVPKALRPQSSDIGGGVLWGVAATTGALFLVQPFDWIRGQLNPPKEEEKK